MALHERLTAQGWIEPSAGGWQATAEGAAGLAALGVDGATHCRDCMDWSERRPHLAGALGSGMAAAFQAKGWLRRPTPRADNPLDRRRLTLSPEGARQLRDTLGIAL